jgi:hypothetical protein
MVGLTVGESGRRVADMGRRRGMVAAVLWSSMTRWPGRKQEENGVGKGVERAGDQLGALL